MNIEHLGLYVNHSESIMSSVVKDYKWKILGS